MKATVLGALKTPWHDATGFNPDQDDGREYFIRDVRSAREFLWSMPDAREAFFEMRGEAVTRRFRRPNRHGSQANLTYSFVQTPDHVGPCVGISLPHWVSAGCVLRVNGIPIPLYSQHRADADIRNSPAPTVCYRAMDLGEGYPLPVDHDITQPFSFQCQDVRDNDKIVTVRHDGQNEAVRLSQAVTQTATPVNHLDRRGLSFPIDLRGPVEVRQGNTLLLVVIPGQSVPDHRRFAIDGARAGMPIEWEGIDVPRPVWYDTDPIECGNHNLWENLFRFQTLNRKTSRNTSEERSYQSLLQLVSGAASQELAGRQSDNQMPNLKPQKQGGLQHVRRVARVLQNPWRRYR